MKVKSDSEVAQSCPTLSDPMDCSLPGSSVHGIFQARVLEWGAIAFSIHNQQEAENAFQGFVESRSTDFYATEISKLISRWQKCIDCNDSYFDE